MLRCKNCQSEIPDNAEKCLTCGLSAGPPNVRAAGSPEEENALEDRYQAAYRQAAAKGCSPILEKFDRAVQSSCAVINLKARDLHFFVTGESNLYSNYEIGVER